jgi:hypothetical protein
VRRRARCLTQLPPASVRSMNAPSLPAAKLRNFVAPYCREHALRPLASCVTRTWKAFLQDNLGVSIAVKAVASSRARCVGIGSSPESAGSSANGRGSTPRLRLERWPEPQSLCVTRPIAPRPRTRTAPSITVRKDASVTLCGCHMALEDRLLLICLECC